MTGVGKTTGFVLRAVVATLEKGQAVLLVAPTTTARTQLVNGLIFAAPDLETQIRVLGAQKLSEREKTLELEYLLQQRLLPLARRVAAANQTLREHLQEWVADGYRNTAIVVAHEAFIEARHAVEDELGPARAAIVEDKGICIATLGALLGATGLDTLPKHLYHVIVDDAGAVHAGELLAFLCAVVLRSVLVAKVDVAYRGVRGAKADVWKAGDGSRSFVFFGVGRGRGSFGTGRAVTPI